MSAIWNLVASYKWVPHPRATLLIIIIRILHISMHSSWESSFLYLFVICMSANFWLDLGFNQRPLCHANTSSATCQITIASPTVIPVRLPPAKIIYSSLRLQQSSQLDHLSANRLLIILILAIIIVWLSLV